MKNNCETTRVKNRYEFICHSPKKRSQRKGLSLLEVVIALAILAMAAAMLAQVSQLATRNALNSQRLANAHILCESKMAEVLAGAIPLEPLDWTLEEYGAVPGEWYYRIEVSTSERENMIGVRLSVSDDPQAVDEKPEVFFLMRWLIDPQLGLDTPPEQTDATGMTGTSGATSSGGMSSGTGTGGGLQ